MISDEEKLCKNCKHCEQFLDVESDYDSQDFRGSGCAKKSEKISCYTCVNAWDDVDICGKAREWFEKGEPSKKIIRKLKFFMKSEEEKGEFKGICSSGEFLQKATGRDCYLKEKSDLSIKLSFTEINDPDAKPREFMFCDGMCLHYWIGQYPKILRWE